MFVQFLRLPPVYDSFLTTGSVVLNLTAGVFLQQHGYCCLLPCRVEATPRKIKKEFTTYNNLSSQTLTYLASFTIDIRSSLLHEPLYLANFLSAHRLHELTIRPTCCGFHSFCQLQERYDQTTTKTFTKKPSNNYESSAYSLR